MMLKTAIGILAAIVGGCYWLIADEDEYGEPRDFWDVAWLKFVGGLCGFVAGCLLAGV